MVGRAEVDDVETGAVGSVERSLVLLRLDEVEVEDSTAGFLGTLGVAILVVCKATGGYESEEVLSSSNTCRLELRRLFVLSSAKTAETTCEAKSATDETSSGEMSSRRLGGGSFSRARKALAPSQVYKVLGPSQGLENEKSGCTHVLGWVVRRL